MSFNLILEVILINIPWQNSRIVSAMTQWISFFRMMMSIQSLLLFKYILKDFLL